MVDLGCGPRLRFFHYAVSRGIQVLNYTGVDPLIEASVKKSIEKNPAVTVVTKSLVKTIALPSAQADVVTAFAFFEHIDYPEEILTEAYRLLKPGGRLIMTAPSFKAKLVLEFLSYRLGLISRREIEEHKQYFDCPTLVKLLPKTTPRPRWHHEYFELGLNNLLVLRKP